MSGLRDQLQTIYDERGKLTPALVVETARAADHPLHERFEWDNEIAGEAYRRVQAAELIRSVRVRDTRGNDESDVRCKVRQFVSVQRSDDPERSYEPVSDVLADPLRRAMLLREMERDWRLFKQRWSHMTEFAELIRKHNEGESA